MKIASFADLHVRGKDIDVFRAQWGEALTVCAERKVDLILVAGDVFDKSNLFDGHGDTGAIAAAFVDPWMEYMSSSCYRDEDGWEDRMIIVEGDHDRAGVGSESGLRVLEHVPGIVINTDGLQFNRHVSNSEAVDLLLVPWSWDGDRDAEAEITALIGAFPRSPDIPRVLVSHIETFGLQMMRGKVSEEGSTNKRTWAARREFLARLDVDRFVLGNYHGRQPVDPDAEWRGGMVGALRQVSFAHEDEPQGFELWDTSIESGPDIRRDSGPEPGCSGVEWVELTSAPYHKTLRFNGEISTADISKAIETLQAANEGRELNIRVRLDLLPGATVAEELSRRGITDIGINVEPTERERRVENMPDDVYANPTSALRMWAGLQRPEPNEGELAAMERELAALI